MLIINRYFNKFFLVGLVCILLLILLIFVGVENHTDLNNNLRVRTADAFSLIDQRMTSLFFEVNIFPRSAGSDVLFLSELSNLNNLINSADYESRDNAIENLENDFLGFVKENTVYYQLRYIDEQGDEIIRVDFDGENYTVFSKANLQNKKERYYFNKTMSLDKREVFISPLDLNIEEGIIENRGTEKNPIYVPIMRYATPVFNYNGESKGIIISNIYTNYFLDDIRKFQRQGEKVFLINENGHYLAHPNKSKEYTFMFERNDSFYDDYPEIPKEILLDFSKRRFESDDLVFSFRHIYPTTGSFEIYEGSKKIFGENSEDNYFWTLMIVSEKDIINKTSKNLKTDYLFFLLFSGLIVLVIVVLVFIIAFKNHNSKSHNGQRG